MAQDNEAIIKLKLDGKQRVEDELIQVREQINQLKREMLDADKASRNGLRKELQRLQVRSSELTNQKRRLNNEIKKETANMYKAAQATNTFSNAAGKATKATGRATGGLGQSIAWLASDIGFLAQNPRMGLMAISNNLTQIAGAASYAAKEAGGLGKAFLNAFKGNIVLIAVQLLISVLTQLPTILDKLGISFKKVGSEIEENITNKLKGNNGAIAKIKLWAEVLNKAKVGTDEHSVALQNLKKLGYDPLVGTDGKEGSLEKFIRLKKASLLLDATIGANSEAIGKKMGEIAQNEEALAKARKGDLSTWQLIKGTITDIGNILSGEGGTNKSIGDFTQEQVVSTLEKRGKQLEKELESLITGGADMVNKILKENPELASILFPNSKRVQAETNTFNNYKKSTSRMNALYKLSGYVRLEAQREFAAEDLKIQRDTEIKRINNLKISEEEKKKLRKQVEADYRTSLELNDEFYDNKQEERAERDAQRAQLKTEKEKQAFDRAVEISARREDILTGIIAKAAERRVQLEQAANDTIRNAKFAFYRELISLGKQFAGENEAVLISLLLIEKGIEAAELVAKASSDAASATSANATANAMITAGAAAIPAFLPPTIPNPAKPIAEANAKAAKLKNNVQLGKTLASIKTATTLGLAGIGVSAIGGVAGILSKGGGGSSSGGGSSDAPNYNIINAQGPNEIAETIKEQTDTLTNQKPMKAYVVAGEVETVQQMEREAQSNVSLG